uniref:Lipase_3 domain-containing protein n=1 Tax=Meloidogyne hapla TaxID=6305 RepID=A0A1I8BQH1_MELHA
MDLHLLVVLFFLNLLYIPNSFAQFNSTFREFLKVYGGQDLERLLTREDLGVNGSYGGGNHKAGEKTKRGPVILVHGTSTSAGTLEPIRQYFKVFRYYISLSIKNQGHGYGDEEVYATTYGDAGKTSLIFVKMKCQFVKMAILGGKCVDTGEELGPPLTHLVHTFVGVAGPNWGSFLCPIPFGACNLLNGMNCLSLYLRNINSKQRYEGSFIYTIFSTGDDIVGYKVCGRLASSIKGENDNFEVEGMTHFEVIFNTMKWQYNLITFQKAEVEVDD